MTPTKPRYRVPAAVSPMEQVDLILEKARDDISDAVDIVTDGQSYDTQFQQGLNRIPNRAENPTGRPVPMSGKGPAEMEAFADTHRVLSGLTQAYELFDGKLCGQDAALKSYRADFLTFGELICDRTGQHDLAKAMAAQREAEAKAAKEAKLYDIAGTLKAAMRALGKADGEEADEDDEDDDTQKAIKSLQDRVNAALADVSKADGEAQDNPQAKSLRAVFAELAGSDDLRVSPPPVMGRAPVAKAADTGLLSDDEISAIQSPSEAAHQMALRQRRAWELHYGRKLPNYGA